MELIDKIFALQNRAPFNVLRHSELILTANITKVKKYHKGETIIYKDSSVQNLFIIEDGKASYKDREISNFFGAEELLNEVTLAENVTAKSDINALVISKGHFYTLIHECPSLMIEIIKYYGENRIEQ